MEESGGWLYGNLPDMALDDIIAANKQRQRQQRRGRQRRGAYPSSVGPIRNRQSQAPHRRAPQPTPYQTRPPNSNHTQTAQQHHMPSTSNTTSRIHIAATKLYISNLHPHKVSDQHLQVLFSDYGTLHSSTIHYDAHGRPMGAGEVVFARKTDALRAMEELDNMVLDGVPLNVELVEETSTSFLS